jgi:hypothetical protein
MNAADAEELAYNAVECLLAIMFDVPLDEIDRFSMEAPPEHPNGMRVEVHLKSGELREHVAKNDGTTTLGPAPWKSRASQGKQSNPERVRVMFAHA